jgi:hypothetical protein
MATSGVLVTQFDYSKLFIWGNLFRTGTYTNATGSTVTLPKGTVMGRVLATNKVYPCISTLTDGSQIARFVLAQDVTVANTASATVTFCIHGKVAREGLIFNNGTDTLATVQLFNTSAAAATTTQAGTNEDLLWAAGIITEATTENTIADNA